MTRDIGWSSGTSESLLFYGLVQMNTEHFHCATYAEKISDGEGKLAS